MKATADLQVIPLGTSITVRDEVTRTVDLLKKRRLIVEPHAAGTNLEGDLDEIMDAVKAVHKLLHDSGSVRLVSYLKLETRTDKTPTLIGKRL